MMTRAYTGEGVSPLCGKIAKEHFLTALCDKDLELKIREREPQDLESAFKHAVRLQALLKAIGESDDREDKRKNRNRRRRDDPLATRITELERRTTAADSNDRQPAGHHDEVQP